MIKLIGKYILIVQFLVCFIYDFRVIVRGGEHDYLNITNNGIAFRGAGPRIYILKDGIKHEVGEWGYFLGLGFESTDIHVYNNSLIDSYPNGDIVSPPKPPPAPPKPPRNPCPCRSSSSHDLSNEIKFNEQTHKKYLICILKNKESEKVFTTFNADQLDLNFLLLPSEVVNKYMLGNATDLPEVNGCDVLLKFIIDEFIDDEIERRCPGVCLPIPYMEVPVQSLNLPHNASRSLTCSLRMSTVISHHNLDSSTPSISEADNVGLILRSIAQRRMEECKEPGLWPMGSFTHKNSTSTQPYSNVSYLRQNVSTFPKRSVYGLIIWVGSIDRIHLSHMQSNLLALQNRTTNDSQKIFGWIATEDVYPCNFSAPVCTYQLGYHWMMPSGLMGYKGNTGWGCAQRRPLRALAHATLLYDSDFVFLVDDDSYINIKLITYEGIFSGIIFKELKNNPVVLGQLTGGGKVTNGGHFYGGAGYLMGRGLINKLNGYELDGPEAYGDRIRNNKHLNHLGLMEVVGSFEGACPDCLQFNGNLSTNIHGIGMKAQLGVRLVEMCKNILSEEGTCYHSDHAISRCFAHAVYADIWNVGCYGWKIPRTDYMTGMCMGCDKCGENVLTCHRWMPNVSTPDLRPMQYHAPERRRLYPLDMHENDRGSSR